MPTNIRILHNFLTDASGVALTGSTASSGYPVANVQDQRIAKVFRTTVKGDGFVKFNMGAATSLTCMAFMHHNLTGSATVRLWGHTSNLGDTAAVWNGVATLAATYTHNNIAGGASAASYISSSLITTGAQATELPPRYLNGLGYFSLSRQWWFLSIQDSGNSADYLELGRVVGGAYVEPTRYLLANYAANMIDPVEELRLEGVIQTMRRTQRRAHRYTLAFGNVAAADLPNHREMFLNTGNSFELLINPRPDTDLNEVIYGKLEGDMQITKKVADYADVKWSILEAA